MGSLCKGSEYNLENAELITAPKRNNKIYFKKNSARFSNIQEISEHYEEEKSNEKSLSRNFFRFRNKSTNLPKSTIGREFLSFDFPNSNTSKKVISKLSMEKFNELFGDEDYISSNIHNKNKRNLKNSLLRNPTLSGSTHVSHLNTCSNVSNNCNFDNINETQGGKVNLV